MRYGHRWGHARRPSRVAEVEGHYVVLSKNSNALKIRYMTVAVANLELNENMVLASDCDYAVGLPASGPHGMREW